MALFKIFMLSPRTREMVLPTPDLRKLMNRIFQNKVSLSLLGKTREGATKACLRIEVMHIF
jgi:hypothetical protein